MAEASPKRTAGVTPTSVSSTPSFYPPLLEKVEGMKKIGVPTEETSKILQGMENRFKAYHNVLGSQPEEDEWTAAKWTLVACARHHRYYCYRCCHGKGI